MSGFAGMIFANRTPPAVGGGGGGDTDPNWANVGLLLKGENTAGTFTFTDLSNNNYTIERLKTTTTATDVVNSSAQSRFGSGSIFVPRPTTNSNGDFILINKSPTSITQPNARIGTNNDWTYEMWYWPISGSPTQRGISGYGFFAFNAALTSSGFTETAFSNTTAGTTTSQHVKLSPTAITFNAWNHLAWTRSGTTMYHFLNGVTQWTQAFTGTLRTFRTVDPFDFGFAIGHRHAGGATGAFTTDSHAWGYLDEVRVTQNVARYTADFTPPTATFPTTA